MDHVIGFGVKGISRTIAVASEVVAGRRSSNTSENSRNHPEDVESDEDIVSKEQDLDDIADDSDEKTKAGDSDDDQDKRRPSVAQDLAKSFINQHETSLVASQVIRPIPQTVVLPQRRPKHRSRGFIRAYAPILNEYSGIDQATFMDFLADFDKAAKAWPIFNVINMAAMGVGAVPHAPFIAASVAMQAVATVGEEVQTRYTTNKFLDDINDVLFKPRKLCAFIMTYRPDLSDDAVLQADITDPHAVALSKIMSKDTGSSLKKKLSRFSSVSSGTARHDSLVPDPAPLIYPALDRALLEGGSNPKLIKSSEPTSSSNSLTPTKSQPNASIIQEYLDRRAQALFIATHPDDKLASTLPPQDKKFVNRFADPNHPVNSGSIFGLVTGGTWDPIANGRVSRAERKARKKGEEPLTAEERHEAYMGRKVRGRVTGTPSKDTLGLKKMFGPSMLYLVITNLPDSSQEALMEK